MSRYLHSAPAMSYSDRLPALRIVASVDPVVRVLIYDVGDPEVIADTRQTINETFCEHGLSGQWTVALSASETRGRWDVGVRGPVGHHFFSFVSSPELIPQFVRHYLTRTFSSHTASRSPSV